MTTFVALLRGVNVGGANRLPMADLRRVAEGCGFGAVQTYIQSGNVVLTSTDAASEVGAVLRDALLAETGIDSAVIVRGLDEMAAVAAGNPFPEAAAADPTRVHVTFLPAAVAHLDGFAREAYQPEEVVAAGAELYLHLPEGLGRSKLATDLLRRTDLIGTTRNWRTVVTLLEMARAAG